MGRFECKKVVYAVCSILTYGSEAWRLITVVKKVIGGVNDVYNHG